MQEVVFGDDREFPRMKCRPVVEDSCCYRDLLSEMKAVIETVGFHRKTQGQAQLDHRSDEECVGIRESSNAERGGGIGEGAGERNSAADSEGNGLCENK